jgi:fucose 4-O-acetylase-like acetyltransferase
MPRVSSVPGPAQADAGAAAVSVSAPTRIRTRLTDLDRAKGIAILLVVFGHLVPQQDPAGVTWYDPLRVAIYLFHMPFFMYLSGYVTFWTGAAGTAPGRWTGLVVRRAKRLLVPFFGFGCVILMAKLVAAHVMHVDNVPQSLSGGLDSLFLHTARSPAMSVWYIGVLFVYVVATPLLLRLPRIGRLPPEGLLLLIAIGLYVIQAPAILYMDRVCRFFIFFVVGGLAARAGASWWAVLDRWHLPALLALLALLIFVAGGGTQFNWGGDAADHFPYKGFMLAAGLLSMVALHGLSRSVAVARWGWLVFVGNMCFAIYLLNTICLGLSKGILLKFLHWDAHDFPVIAAVMFMAGVLGPIAIKRYVLRYIPALDRITD